MYDFTYLRPHAISDVEAALKSAFEPRLLAGGMTLLPSMKARLSSPATLIDLSGAPELRGIELRGDRLEIGAMTRHYDLAGNPLIAEKIAALAKLAGGIGDRQVRYRGTIGGALANADPSADYPAAALALQAELTTNRRRVAVDDFFAGMFTTCLEEDEILCRINLAVPLASSYVKIPHPASGYAMTGAFIARYSDGHRVGVTGAATSYFRHRAAEAALNAGADAESLFSVDVPDQEYMSDIHAPAEYRRNLVQVAVAEAASNLAELGEPSKRDVPTS